MILLHGLSDLNERQHLDPRREEHVGVAVDASDATHDGRVLELEYLEVASEWAEAVANVVWVGVTS